MTVFSSPIEQKAQAVLGLVKQDVPPVILHLLENIVQGEGLPLLETHLAAVQSAVLFRLISDGWTALGRPSKNQGPDLLLESCLYFAWEYFFISLGMHEGANAPAEILRRYQRGVIARTIHPTLSATVASVLGNVIAVIPMTLFDGDLAAVVS